VIAEWGRDEIRSLQWPRLDAGASDRRALGLLLIDPRHDAPAAGNR
jgi:hypothetical protein